MKKTASNTIYRVLGVLVRPLAGEEGDELVPQVEVPAPAGPVQRRAARLGKEGNLVNRA